MAKKNKILMLILPVFFNNAIMGMKSSPYVITFFLKPEYHQHITNATGDTKKPNKSTEAALKSVPSTRYSMHPQTGVYAIYNGTATVSDMNGQITFLRKIVEPKLHFLITEEIEPLLKNPLQKNIIEGFVLEPQINHTLYLLERHENAATKTYEWSIRQEIISKSKKIPYNTIILFANPKDVSITAMNNTIKMDGNLLLPDVYIKPNSNLPLNALSFLKIRQYFSQVKKKYEFKPGLYQERIA